jgi:uncharacterized protein
VEYELTLLGVSALLVAGLLGGFINTLAGGGSMLTLPALMMLGMPADVANATNRVGVFLQCLTGIKGFKDNDRLDTRAIFPIIIPNLMGGIVGSILASYLPVWVLKPTLLIAMVSMAVIMVAWPAVVAPPEGTAAHRVQDRPLAAVALFVAGVYGGFVQAGVGFILIAALAGGLRYDLVRSNALKLACTAVFTGVALLVFIVRDQVLWVPGLILATGTVTGAAISVRFAIKVPQTTLKWILIVMVSITCGAALFFG